MNDFTAHTSSDTNEAQFLAPETHQRAEGEGAYAGFSATYSPDDNKLRLYASARLDTDTYKRVRAAGFIWAPKQDLFVAPMWTPGRADLLMELCGDIGDEDTSLVDRAEERADRFTDYHDSRLHDAGAAHRAVEHVSQRFEMGQPILVGHHSERKARKDAERMENGMRKAVKMWDTAQYWKQRAAGALQHARYKERADVRARRIKGIEADKRKQERTRAEAVKWQGLWATEGLTLEQARAIANQCWLTVIRDKSGAGGWTAYDVLRPDGERYKACPAWTVDQVQAAAAPAYARTIAWCDRWIAHYENRLTYERAMLDEQGGIAATKTGPERGGAAKCWASPTGGWSYIKKVNKVSVTVEDNWGNGGGNFTRTIPFDKLTQLMTAAQVEEARAGGRLQETTDKTGFHLVRSSPDEGAGTAPAAAARAASAAEAKEEARPFDALREQLRAGVQVVVAPQLFNTPAAEAVNMVKEVLDLLQPGARVLEPNVGTGRLLEALAALRRGLDVVAVDINHSLVQAQRGAGLAGEVVCADFLTCTPEQLGGLFDVVLMNPPFADGADVRHILHAQGFLKPGGRLVAICANGPRQQAKLLPIVERTGGHWVDLPEGTFGDEGTNVRTARITIQAD